MIQNITAALTTIIGIEIGANIHFEGTSAERTAQVLGDTLEYDNNDYPHLTLSYNDFDFRRVKLVKAGYKIAILTM